MYDLLVSSIISCFWLCKGKLEGIFGILQPIADCSYQESVFKQNFLYKHEGCIFFLKECAKDVHNIFLHTLFFICEILRFYKSMMLLA